MFTEMTIAKKVFWGFIAIVILAAGSGMWGLMSVMKISANAERATYAQGTSTELSHREIDHLMWVKKLNGYLRNPEGKILDIQLDHTQCNFGKWLYGSGRKDTETLFPEIAGRLKAIEEPHRQLHESAKEIKAARTDAGNASDAQRIYEAKSEPALSAIQGLLNDIRGDVEKHAREEDKKMAEAVQSFKHNTIVSSLVSLLTGLLLAFLIKRGIARVLKRVIQGLVVSSVQVASTTGQLSAASKLLAEGSSQQAASVEETSSSLEEMASRTRQNAANARQADTLIKNAQQVARQASASMGELNRSMEEISAASSESSKIIKTIDEIAFQTNLLALNAAVEAARAGEAGAGFAVVADEVRNLAMRAAEAARNTAGLIEGTVTKVKSGTDLVARTNEAFSSVSTGVEKVSGLVSEIAVASNEQSQGIDQVNKTVGEMDKVIQQNAATAEESSGASHELTSQAEQMKSMVKDLVALIGTNTAAGGTEPSAKQIAKSRRVQSAEHIRPTKGKTALSRATPAEPETVIPLEEAELRDF